VPVAAQLLTLTYHPGLDLVVVFIREGDGAGGCYSGSGLVMEMPRFHETRSATREANAARTTAVPQSGEPSHVIARSPPGATPLKRKYSRGASTEVEREMHRYKRGTAKSGKGGRGGKVKSRKQAIAIALSKARKKGKKVPRKKK
jgi:uncharacterized protein DUF6496